MKYVIGIDEAGRGPLAGPVSVGIFGADKKMEKWLLKNIFDNKLRDSKKLIPKKREEIYKKFCLLKKENKISFSVSHVSNKIIDKKGISFAIKKAIANCLKKLEHTLNYTGLPCVYLDGLLKAPAKFKNQKTIIKGDEKDVFIACASIVAKVSRDRLMCRLGLKYLAYSLEIHKGYGTKLHYKLLKKYGLSEIHRKSFCKNI
jgi:ribonuclease HII